MDVYMDTLQMIFVSMLVLSVSSGVMAEDRPKPVVPDLFRHEPRAEVRPSGRQDGSYELYRGWGRQGRLVPDGTGGYRLWPDLGRPTYDKVPGVTAPK